MDERSKKNIQTLSIKAQEMANKWLKKCLDEGLNIKIISGRRTWEEQDKLYAIGRTQAGKIVTKAKGGFSYHNFGIAWDFGVFDDLGNYLPEDDAYDTAGKIAKELGLEWGGDWKFVDKPHIQLKTGLTLTQMRNKFKSGEAIV